MIQLLRKIKVPVTLAKPTGASCAHLKKRIKALCFESWDLSNKNASMIHHGKWLISSDLNHRRCDNSMTVTRHKGGCVFVQRWNMPSTLKDATYRCIPLQMEKTFKKKHQHKTSLLGFCVFLNEKKTLSLKSSILKEVQVPFARPKLGVLSTHGGSKCRRLRRPRRENPNGATSTFGPSGACKKKGQERWIVTWSKCSYVFVGVAVCCCIFSVVFPLVFVLPLVGHVCFGLWFVCPPLNGLRCLGRCWTSSGFSAIPSLYTLQ